MNNATQYLQQSLKEIEEMGEERQQMRDDHVKADYDEYTKDQVEYDEIFRTAY